MANNVRSMSTEGLDPEYLARRAALPTCLSCERPMRPAGKRAADWPATVAYATTDQCKSCYNRKYVVSASAALKQVDGVKAVKRVKARVRGVETTVPRIDLSRQEVAARWTDEERSAATQIACMGVRAGDRRAESPHAIRSAVDRQVRKDVDHILDMLGLFDAEKMSGYGLTDDPKGASKFI